MNGSDCQLLVRVPGTGPGFWNCWPAGDVTLYTCVRRARSNRRATCHEGRRRRHMHASQGPGPGQELGPPSVHGERTDRLVVLFVVVMPLGERFKLLGNPRVNCWRRRAPGAGQLSPRTLVLLNTGSTAGICRGVRCRGRALACQCLLGLNV